MPDRVLLRLLIVVYAVTFMGSAVLLSLFGEQVGLERGLALWLWAALMTALAALMFGPLLARRAGLGRALVIGGLLLAAGAGVYAYVALVMAPSAAERASAAEVARDGGKPGG